MKEVNWKTNDKTKMEKQEEGKNVHLYPYNTEMKNESSPNHPAYGLYTTL